MTKTTRWDVTNKGTNRSRMIPLELYWEVHCDPISDDYAPEEDPAALLWDRWLLHYPPSRYPEYETAFGLGCVPIFWYVQGPGVFESAPFQDERVRAASERNFLTHYDWPFPEEGLARLRWQALPVVDKLWRPGRADKGGFIQEATGWKPSALQPFVNVRTLAKASHLPWFDK